EDRARARGVGVGEHLVVGVGRARQHDCATAGTEQLQIHVAIGVGEGHVHAHGRACGQRDRVPVLVEALDDHIGVARPHRGRARGRTRIVRLLRVVGAHRERRGKAPRTHGEIPAAIAVVGSGVLAGAASAGEHAVHALVAVAIDGAARGAALCDAVVPGERVPIRARRAARERAR
ncbi:MAG: hypothetical protein ACK56I_15845, partial [bacterium]